MYAELIGAISNFMYGKLLIIMLIGVGLYYTFRTRFIQLRLLGETLRVITEKKADKNSVSSFQALMVSTASRVGTGNIIGMILAAPVLFLWQGMFWLVAHLSSQAVSDALMSELLIVGGLMITGSGLALLNLKDCKTLNFLPALAVPVVWFVIKSFI